MIYKCLNPLCNFLFSRSGLIEQCPDCGKTHIRPATAQECAEFEKELSQSEQVKTCER